MDGGAGFSIHVATTVLKSEDRLRLRHGEILSVRVEQQLGENRYSIAIGRSTLPIVSTKALSVGMVLRTRVLSRGGRIELKIIQPDSTPGAAVARLAGSAVAIIPPGLPSAFATLLIQSMRRSGMAVTPEALAAISAMIPHSRRGESSFIRFATILFDKHLHIERERLEELYLTITGQGRHEANRGESSHSHPSHKRKEGDRNARGSPPGNGLVAGGKALEPERAKADSGPPHPVSLTEDLCAQFRAQVAGRGDFEAGWSALFNHKAGAHEAWVIVPFCAVGDRTTVDGSVRLLLDPAILRAERGASPMRVSRAVVSVNELGSFEITGMPPSRIRIHSYSREEQSKLIHLLPELREKLRNLGVEIDDTNNGGAVFDGFTAETHEIRDVDATA